MRTHSWLMVLAVGPAALAAQAPRPSSKPVTPPPDPQQIAAAVLAVPTEFRTGARVLGYHAGSARLVTLREGTGPFVCLASDPAGSRFHVACYHQSLEPFMARGRSLRAEGITGDRVDSVRFAEIRAGKLAMPKEPAALYSLTGPLGSFDPGTGTVHNTSPLFVIYISGATAASTGLSTQPQIGAPWIMFPGTPKAHIMLVPKM